MNDRNLPEIIRAVMADVENIILIPHRFPDNGTPVQLWVRPDDIGDAIDNLLLANVTAN